MCEGKAREILLSDTAPLALAPGSPHGAPEWGERGRQTGHSWIAYGRS